MAKTEIVYKSKAKKPKKAKKGDPVKGFFKGLPKAKWNVPLKKKHVKTGKVA